ncbi:uncharacterized protein RB166_009402 [Leptodactylus fuscus]|uniref:uncharacterized protein LOC142204032 n=1 Tax=Leptodactylus fuscus TaxID=238119 RepID=UPI003F4F1C60
MSALKNLLFRKKRYRNSAWRKVCNAWDNIHIVSTWDSPDCNPWSEWCKAWEEFRSSAKKPPKAERAKAEMFLELYNIAQQTGDKLEEAKIMRTDLNQKTNDNIILRNQNFVLQKRCEELQRQLDAEKQTMTRNNQLNEKNLKREVDHQIELQNQIQQKNQELQNLQKLFRNQNLALQNRCEELQRQLDAEKETMTWNNQLNEKNLKREVNHQIELQNQMDDLMFEVQLKNQELQKLQDECRKLEKKCSSSERQLVKFTKIYSPQITFKNDIIVTPRCGWNPLGDYPQLQNGEEERSLDLHYITDIAGRLGMVTRSNVFDWLCSFEVEHNIGTWTRKDFEQILRRCMDSSSFSSLPLRLMMNGTNWVYTLKQIAERFVPNLDHLLATEIMRDDDTALQYLHRMWMIYRIVEFPSVPTKNDEDYISCTIQGLTQHLYEAIEDVRADYESIERDVLSAEYSWAEQEGKQQLWRKKTMKAGAGCPSRYKIWKRLENHLDSVPYEEINGAPYWDLVVMLSRQEDLGTGEPR